MDEKEFYLELTKRNGYFINSNLQKKIKETTLVFIGCGLASSVAVAAARLGFKRFILVDGDDVEVSNLNRQAFYISEIGKNKAEVTAEKIKNINSFAEIEIIQKYLKAECVDEVVSKGEIIINSADFTEVTYEIDRAARKQNKLSISPLNIGFGSVITNFTKQSKTLEEMTSGQARNDKEYLLNLYKNLKDFTLPPYVKKNLVKIFIFIAKKGFFPQNIIAAESSVVLILNTVLRYLEGKEIKLAPNAVSMDVEGNQ